MARQVVEQPPRPARNFQANLERAIRLHPQRAGLLLVMNEMRCEAEGICNREGLTFSHVIVKRNHVSLLTNIFYFAQGRAIAILTRQISDVHLLQVGGAVVPTQPPPERMTTEVLLAKLESLGCAISATGSRFMCDPPVMNTDEDYLVDLSCSSHQSTVTALLFAQGFVEEGRASSASRNSGHRSEFKSWRRGTLNLITTVLVAFANRHRQATALCRRLNLLEKADRIAVFQIIMYGEEYGENYQLMTIAQNEVRELQ
jgi:hypothetical protein